MTKEEKIKEILNAMQEVEEDIGMLHNNITKAREYLINNKLEDIDSDYFDNVLDIEQGLKHIKLF